MQSIVVAEPKPDTPSLLSAVLTNVANAVSQMICTHDDVRVFGVDRVYMRCLKCRRETPGWQVSPRAN